MDPSEARQQIAQSKADLETHLKLTVSSFCYPSGRYNAALESQVSAAGYLDATTTRWDDDYHDPYALPRVRISGGMSLDHFVAAVQ
jgi:hypothetical protein